MCGFAGVVRTDRGGVEPAVLERMADSIRHRGPDDEGFHVDGSVGFGFRRLSILDLTEAGHQPMESPDGRAVIVFNGEIFNYVELRAELEAKGHAFRSTGDTEVLLAAYREWGRDCLARLNGMWAFLIHDKKRNLVFGARDRFGIKPLYMHRGRDAVCFGSEIKALFASGLVPRRPNWAVAARFLLLEQLGAGDCAGETFFDGVEQLPPGTAFELGLDGTFRSWRWWSLESFLPEPMDDPRKEFADLFEDAVRIRLRSDVPVGVCLSGGLDSTSILCSMARQRDAADPLQAFTYNAADFDESSYVADTVRRTGAELNRIELKEAIDFEDLGRLLWFYDQPVHSTAPVVGFELMRLAARKGVKVVLNGQGADETLAGYGSYFQNWWHSLLSRGRFGRAWSEMRAWGEAHGRDPAELRRESLRRLVRAQFRRVGFYRRLSHARERRAAMASPWFTPELARHLPSDTPPYADFSLRGALLDGVRVDPLQLYLRADDRISMAHSVEARLPFLDWRLVAFCFRVPDAWKTRGPWNKYLLREAMAGRIPESVRARLDKMGFPTQHRDWFAGPWYAPMRDMLADRVVRERGIYDVDALEAGLERHRKGEVNLSQPLLFNVAQMEFWLRGAGASAAAVPGA